MTAPARSEAPVEGTCDPAFARVREAFRGNFAEHGEIGAALSIRVGGRLVVDLWGGYADAERAAPWRQDTLVNAYSVGKGVLAALTLRLVEQGLVALDRPVAELWPEFAAGGKERVTLRMLLAHRGGLPAIAERLPEGAMFDWARMCGALAAQPPWWEPDSAHGYHVNTFGFLVGEVLARAAGRPVAALLREHVTGPLGADFHFGLPRAQHARVATMVVHDFAPQGPEHWALAFPPTGDAARDRMIWHTYFNPSGLSGLGVINTPAWRESVIPSTSGHATAHAVAAIYAALLPGAGAGSRLAGAALVAEARDQLLSGRPQFAQGSLRHYAERLARELSVRAGGDFLSCWAMWNSAR